MNFNILSIIAAYGQLTIFSFEKMKTRENLMTHKVPAGKHLPTDKGSIIHLN